MSKESFLLSHREDDENHTVLVPHIWILIIDSDRNRSHQKAEQVNTKSTIAN